MNKVYFTLFHELTQYNHYNKIRSMIIRHYLCFNIYPNMCKIPTYQCRSIFTMAAFDCTWQDKRTTICYLKNRPIETIPDWSSYLRDECWNTDYVKLIFITLRDTLGLYISVTLSNIHVQQNNTNSSVSIMQFNTSVISRGNDSIEIRKSSLNTCEHLIIWRIRFYQRQLWFATDGVQNSSSVYIIEQHWNTNTWYTKLPCENGSPMPYSDGLHPL